MDDEVQCSAGMAASADPTGRKKKRRKKGYRPGDGSVGEYVGVERRDWIVSEEDLWLTWTP